MSTSSMRKDFPPKNGNPIEFDKGRWWFWDETWSDRYGPYDSKADAERELQSYVRLYLEPQPPIIDPGPAPIVKIGNRKSQLP